MPTLIASRSAFTKPGFDDLHAIRARPETHDAKHAFGRRRDFARDAARGVGHDHRRAGDDSLLAVRDRSLDGPAELGADGACDEDEHYQRKQEDVAK